MSELTHGEQLRASLATTQVAIDNRVKSVADFMQQTLQADDLRGVAEAIALIAPAIWGQHRYEKVNPVGLHGVL